MKITVVTTGYRFTDVDSLACAIAYQELLELEGKKSIVFLPGVLNNSITSKIDSWDFKYQKSLKPGVYEFVMVDISESDYFANEVVLDDITEVYDHHFGFEDYWKNRAGVKSKIEKVGACATLIWEEYKERGKDRNISTVCANLLLTAIVSNSLNFKSSVTTERDKKAYEELLAYSNLPNNWIEIYFEDQERGLYQDIKEALVNDTKVRDFEHIGFKLVIAQLELWNSSEFVMNYKKDIRLALETFSSDHWFLTSPSISEGRNYFYTESNKVKDLLEKSLEVKFRGDIGTNDKLILRKEILKILMQL